MQCGMEEVVGGAYRSMEDGWAKELRAGKKVVVEIIPKYIGTSRRPNSITVIWEVNGKQNFQFFPNEAKGRASGKR